MRIGYLGFNGGGKGDPRKRVIRGDGQLEERGRERFQNAEKKLGGKKKTSRFFKQGL